VQLISQTGSKNNRRKLRSLIKELSGEDALTILGRLAEEDQGLANRIENMAREILSIIDFASIAEEVLWALNQIEVEELWDRSGKTRHGYIEPDEMAWTLIEEALTEYTGELNKYLRLSLLDKAKVYCLGIIKGLYLFDCDSKTEFTDWAVDIPEQFSLNLICELEKKYQDIIKDIKEQSAEMFPGWSL